MLFPFVALFYLVNFALVADARSGNGLNSIGSAPNSGSPDHSKIPRLSYTRRTLSPSIRSLMHRSTGRRSNPSAGKEATLQPLREKSPSGTQEIPVALSWNPHAAEISRVNYYHFPLKDLPTWRGGQKVKHDWRPPPGNDKQFNRPGIKDRKGFKGGKAFGRGYGWIEIEPGAARYISFNRFEGIKTPAVREGIIMTIFNNNEVLMSLTTPEKVGGLDDLRRLAMARNMVAWTSIVAAGPNQRFFHEQLDRAVSIMNAFSMKGSDPLFVPLPIKDAAATWRYLKIRFDRAKGLHMGLTE